MSKITQLKQNDEVIYPKTIFDAVLTSDGSTLSSKYDYIRRNYTKRSELINDLDIDFDPSTKSLELSLGNINLSTINTDNFAISGILDSASFNNDVLTLNFTSGDSVGIDLTEILSAILTDYKTEVRTLRQLHTVLSKTDYDELLEKDPNVFYYTYEED